MANTPYNLEKGLGSFGAVLDHHAGKYENGTTLTHDYRTLLESIRNISADDNGPMAIKAIACAILNADFRKTNYLFSVTAAGRATFDIVADEQPRNIVADSLGL